MQNQTKKQSGKKSRFRGFYTSIGISLIMIGAACWYAYAQTSRTLEQNFDSITEQIAVETTTVTHETTESAELPVIEVQTDVPRETQTQVVAEQSTAIPESPESTTETETVRETESTEASSMVHQIVAPLTDYRVLNPFSNGELVKSETTGTWQTHNGVDLACAADADVYAIDGGTIIAVTNDALWGYTVTIDHDNGVTSRYCGLDGSLEIREGDVVQSGQKIGTIGNTADIESSQESHLHLEVLKSGVYIDPVSYLES